MEPTVYKSRTSIKPTEMMSDKSATYPDKKIVNKVQGVHVLILVL